MPASQRLLTPTIIWLRASLFSTVGYSFPAVSPVISNTPISSTSSGRSELVTACPSRVIHTSVIVVIALNRSGDGLCGFCGERNRGWQRRSSSSSARDIAWLMAGDGWMLATNARSDSRREEKLRRRANREGLLAEETDRCLG